MDDVAGDKDKRSKRGANREPKHKYMDMLQRVADRQQKQITIDLEDLDNVGFLSLSYIV